jgi:glutathione S-transferase
MTRPVLFGNHESGHAYKAKLALTLLGIDHEYRAVDLDVPLERRRPDFLQASRFGEVPVLVDGAVTLAQSDAILLYLAAKTGRLGGDLPMQHLTEWMFWEANRIGFSVPNLRAGRTYAAGTRSPDVIAWLEQRAHSDLARLDHELAGRPFLLGPGLTVVDIACCAYLFWPEQAGLELSLWANVVQWLDRIRALPGWAAPYDLLRPQA